MSELINADGAPDKETQAKEDMIAKMKEWAEDIRKADERCEQFRGELMRATDRNKELQEALATVEKQVAIREEEIKRLHGLYEGG